jgi:hypothetical protein
MKLSTKLTIISLVILIVTIAAPAALAQEQLPDTAVEALQQAGLILAGLGAALGGYLGSTLTDALKRNAKWMSKEIRDNLGAWVARSISIIASGASAVLVDAAMKHALNLDKTGLWGAIVTIVMVAGAPIVSEILHRLRKATQKNDTIIGLSEATLESVVVEEGA